MGRRERMVVSVVSVYCVWRFAYSVMVRINALEITPIVALLSVVPVVDGRSGRNPNVLRIVQKIVFTEFVVIDVIPYA